MLHRHACIMLWANGLCLRQTTKNHFESIRNRKFQVFWYSADLFASAQSLSFAGVLNATCRTQRPSSKKTLQNFIHYNKSKIQNKSCTDFILFLNPRGLQHKVRTLWYRSLTFSWRGRLLIQFDRNSFDKCPIQDS